MAVAAGSTALIFVVIFPLVLATANHDVSRATKNPHMLPGSSVIVHLFEWKFQDIAKECEGFLGPMGYGGVQVSPVTEHGIIRDGLRVRPWYERYQPVSYKIDTRIGNEDQFKNMVRRCNQAGVRIYVDVILNHMTSNLKIQHGTAGSVFNYGERRYDGIPYNRSDFHNNASCHSKSGGIDDFNDASQVRNCELLGLLDLDQSREHVRERVLSFLNRLISYGVSGFRVDAARHMSPQDLSVIYGRLQNLSTEFFPPHSRPFIYQEVIDMGHGGPITKWDYNSIGRVTEFLYGAKLTEVLLRKNGQMLKYLDSFGESWGMLPSGDAVAFIDNHDNQRGHEADAQVLSFFSPRLYKMATAFMLAWPYGVARVMSSYFWHRNLVNGKDLNYWIGPPMDGEENIKSVITYPNNTCGNGWICEHRWRQIYNMVKFRNVSALEPVSHWWDNGYQAIAFGRRSRAYIVINHEDFVISRIFDTGMPSGTYCDVISGSKSGRTCTGRQVLVDSHGHADITVDNKWEDPMIAIHVEAKL
ncbi:alpha-amylase-like [Ornithodoros turicata]|uniref:alpha-amylase-like n=1 Tax=Ornithodoros turicata TaxID=34597 RepID=UPI003138F06D